jgi:hypothetical protein
MSSGHLGQSTGNARCRAVSPPDVKIVRTSGCERSPQCVLPTPGLMPEATIPFRLRVINVNVRFVRALRTCNPGRGAGGPNVRQIGAVTPGHGTMQCDGRMVYSAFGNAAPRRTFMVAIDPRGTVWSCRIVTNESRMHHVPAQSRVPASSSHCGKSGMHAPLADSIGNRGVPRQSDCGRSTSSSPTRWWCRTRQRHV